MTTSTKDNNGVFNRDNAERKQAQTQARAKGRVWQEEFDLLLMKGHLRRVHRRTTLQAITPELGIVSPLLPLQRGIN
jgi:hypothetical protein